MIPGPNELVALVVATSFAAGLNVYAMVGTLGLLARSGMIVLPPSVHLVTDWPVIVAAWVLFVVEMAADKIPVFDVLWNALQTFVRVPVAALLAYGTTAQLSPGAQVAATVVGGTIAFMAHSAKTTARVAVTPSPEPVSNIALSAGEDVVAIGLTWLATQHPLWAAAITLTLLVVIAALVRWIVRAARTRWRR